MTNIVITECLLDLTIWKFTQFCRFFCFGSTCSSSCTALPSPPLTPLSLSPLLCHLFPFPAHPCLALPSPDFFAHPSPAHPSTAIPWPLSTPALPSLPFPCPSQPYPAMAVYSIRQFDNFLDLTQAVLIFISAPSVHHPALPCSPLTPLPSPVPTLPCPLLPYPALLFPDSPTLSCPTLPWLLSPALPSPPLPSPSLPSPALPCHAFLTPPLQPLHSPFLPSPPIPSPPHALLSPIPFSLSFLPSPPLPNPEQLGGSWEPQPLMILKKNVLHIKSLFFHEFAQIWNLVGCPLVNWF